MKTGQVREDDYGGLHFRFDDGTEAAAAWVPFGELGDGQGGGFEEDEVEVCDSGLTPAQIVALANANSGCLGSWRPITSD